MSEKYNKMNIVQTMIALVYAAYMWMKAYEI
jgi:hypothetical protein